MRPSRIAHARHVGHGTVGVGARARVVGGVPQHEVAARLEASARLGGVGDEPSFSMGDGGGLAIFANAVAAAR